MSKYVDSPSELPELEVSDEDWIQNHVRQSQYCLQITKCADKNCCKALRTVLHEILPGRFLPTPLRFVHSEQGKPNIQIHF